MRNALAPLASGHALDEIVAVKTRMGIGANKFMFNLHTFSLSGYFLLTPFERAHCKGVLTTEDIRRGRRILSFSTNPYRVLRDLRGEIYHHKYLLNEYFLLLHFMTGDPMAALFRFQ